MAGGTIVIWAQRRPCRRAAGRGRWPHLAQRRDNRRHRASSPATAPTVGPMGRRGAGSRSPRASPRSCSRRDSPRLRGGAAWASGNGGPAGTLVIEGEGRDPDRRHPPTARGGMVAATGPAGAHGRRGGAAILIGETTRPRRSSSWSASWPPVGSVGRAACAVGLSPSSPSSAASRLRPPSTSSGGASVTQPGARGPSNAPVGEATYCRRADRGTGGAHLPRRCRQRR